MKYLFVTLLVSFLIFLHELGHFLAAKRIGIPVARFSLGFGPRLWSWRPFGRETEYCISLIPIGGYILPDLEYKKELLQMPMIKRLVFAAGGPLFNLLTGMLFFSAANVLAKGLSYTNIFLKPFQQAVFFLEEIVSSLGLIVNQPEQLSGVVGIVTGGAALMQHGIIDALLFCGVLSLNIAIFNLLPIPVLDGGQIILTIFERVNPRVNKIRLPLVISGWIIIFGLMIYATSQDIIRLLGS